MRAPLLLNFAGARQLDPRVTFSRSSGSVLLGPGNTLIEVPTGASRFNHTTLSYPEGLVIEPSFTNRIRNSRLEGSAAPALPTNVTASTSMNSMTATLVARGTYLGRQYADIRLQGTPTGTTSDVWFEANNQITASVSQRWAWQYEIMISGGTTTNVDSVQPFCEERNSGTAFLSSRFGSTVLPTTTSVSLSGFNFSTTEATCFYLRPSIRFNWTSTGVATDITYRIMLPFCSQVDRRPLLSVLAPVGAPAATTKAAETATVNLADFDMPAITELTAVVWARTPRAGSLSHTFMTIDDGTTANRIELRRSASNFPEAQTFISSTSQGTVTTATSWGSNTSSRMAIRATSSAMSVATSDGIISIGSFNAVPTGLNRLLFSDWTGAIQKVAIWPLALTDAELLGLIT